MQTLYGIVMVRRLGLLALVLLGTAATCYQSEGFFGGYRDTQLAPDMFRISFVGNGYVSKAQAQDYAMRRATEITLRHGYRYFVVLDQQDSANALGKPETVLMIGCTQEKVPGVFMFDAQFLQHSLREKSK